MIHRALFGSVERSSTREVIPYVSTVPTMSMRNGDFSELGDISLNDPANPGTTGYNQVIGTGKYYTQTEFSNADFTADNGKGCVSALGAAPQRVFDPPALGEAQVAPFAHHPAAKLATIDANRIV